VYARALHLHDTDDLPEETRHNGSHIEGPWDPLGDLVSLPGSGIVDG
jgi:hypothetical protein